MRQGYRVSRSHTEPLAIKTDAPSAAQWDVLRCWAATQKARAAGRTRTVHSPHTGRLPLGALLTVCAPCVGGAQARTKGLSESSPAHAILATPPATQADFTPHEAAVRCLSLGARGALANEGWFA